MRSLRVLVVEDDIIIGALLGEMIVEMGHEVCAVATTEAEAVAAAELYDPGLMVVDARLGVGGSGVSAMREILLRGPLPHLFMSGARVADVAADAIVLRKPFSEADLAAAMRRALSV